MIPCRHGDPMGFCGECDRMYRRETHLQAAVLYGPAVLLLIVWGAEIVRDIGHALGWWGG